MTEPLTKEEHIARAMLMGLVYDERDHSYSDFGKWICFFQHNGVLGAYDADTLEFLPEQVFLERRAKTR